MNAAEEGENPLERARRLDSVEAARDLYDQWADRYDADVFETMGVTGSRRIADLLAQHVPDRDTPVVDLGCGTGVVGRHLADHGFTHLTGLDLSPGMLAGAEKTLVYERVLEADLNEPPKLLKQFGASVSAGTFTTGHVGAAAVPRLLRLLEPGATIVWAIAHAWWPAFEMALQRASVQIVSSATETIRPDTADRSHMVVGILPTG